MKWYTVIRRDTRWRGSRSYGPASDDSWHNCDVEGLFSRVPILETKEMLRHLYLARPQIRIVFKVVPYRRRSDFMTLKACRNNDAKDPVVVVFEVRLASQCIYTFTKQIFIPYIYHFFISIIIIFTLVVVLIPLITPFLLTLLPPLWRLCRPRRRLKRTAPWKHQDATTAARSWEWCDQ